MTASERAAQEIVDYIETQTGVDLSDNSDRKLLLLMRIRQIIDKHLC